MLILNLTTTSTRLELCSATVWSLIHQEKKPDAIYIWVSVEPYLSDRGIKYIPDWVDEINSIRNIVKVEFTKNIGPYRKIIPALRKFSAEDILVYVDDDVIYGNMWLGKLFDKFQAFDGDCIVASRVRLISKNLFGKFKSYSSYPITLKSEKYYKDYIITGVGGCLLKKEFINPDFISMDHFLEIAPKTDDLWLSKIFQLSNVKLVTAPEAIMDVLEINHSNFALTEGNTNFKKNKGVTKILFRLISKVTSYLGVENTNNDICFKKINDFFNK